MKNFFPKYLWTLVCTLLIFAEKVQAQQYNSDSFLSKPHGTMTIIPTVGQRSSMIMNTISLFPKWELTYAMYAYHKDRDLLTDDGHSSSFYAKYMFYENKTHDGGAAVKFGTGLFPGLIQNEDKDSDAFTTYWVNFPTTIPLFETLSWDIIPGTSYTRPESNDQSKGWGFTYSTRLAYYPFAPNWGIVGEAFGTEGQRTSPAEYRIGVRWEKSANTVFALTYGEQFNGAAGAGIEFGVMLFTPQFACLGKCKKYEYTSKGL